MLMQASMAQASHVLAVGGGGQQGASNFLQTTFGNAVVVICGAVGVLVAIVCIMRMIKHVSGGKPAEGFKVLIFGLVIASLLFDLNMTVSAAGTMGGLVNDAFSSVGQLTGTGGNGGNNN